jgi:hypothetical protein
LAGKRPKPALPPIQRPLRKCSIKTATWAILGALNWSVQWFSTKKEITVDEPGQEFADLFNRGLLK